MTAKPGHLKSRGWLDLKPRSREELKKRAAKREGERRAVNVAAPVLDWKKK